MKTKEERKARRKEILGRIIGEAKDAGEHVARPLDEDDKEVVRELATALLVLIVKGQTTERLAALNELWENFKEARSNTP